jgi:hypothetical protein
MSIFATPPKAGIQIREGQDGVAGDDFPNRYGRRRFGNATGGRCNRLGVTSARGSVESLLRELGDWQSAEPWAIAVKKRMDANENPMRPDISGKSLRGAIDRRVLLKSISQRSINRGTSDGVAYSI